MEHSDAYIRTYIHTYTHTLFSQHALCVKHFNSYIHTYIHTHTVFTAQALHEILKLIHTYIHTHTHYFHSTSSTSKTFKFEFSHTWRSNNTHVFSPKDTFKSQKNKKPQHTREETQTQTLLSMENRGFI